MIGRLHRAQLMPLRTHVLINVYPIPSSCNQTSMYYRTRSRISSVIVPIVQKNIRFGRLKEHGRLVLLANFIT